MVISEILPFHACKRCAACCKGKVIPLYSPDFRRLSGLEGFSVHTSKLERALTGAHYKMRMAGSRCVFLQGGLCSHYELRPDTCRRHPFIVTENWILVNPACPGIDWNRKNIEGEEHYRKLSSGISDWIDALVGSAGGITSPQTRRVVPRKRGAP
ncbi:MAG: YkgJ family cysteine cluster protein [Candidatus Verstraetearchaeota archaeon]|nr:YkgJ family cysteine cluster protein [Candidatus Verstraetearchaeota archaeon]